MSTTPRIFNIMADGSVRNSVEGLIIPNKEFYIIYNEIRSKQNERTKTNTQNS